MHAVDHAMVSKALAAPRGGVTWQRHMVVSCGCATWKSHVAMCGRERGGGGAARAHWANKWSWRGCTAKPALFCILPAGGRAAGRAAGRATGLSGGEAHRAGVGGRAGAGGVGGAGGVDGAATQRCLSCPMAGRENCAVAKLLSSELRGVLWPRPWQGMEMNCSCVWHSVFV